MNLGLAIKEIRKNQGWSQVELAKAAKISQTALSQIENGKRPGEKTIQKISNVLKTPVALFYIMAFEEKDVPVSKKMLYKQLFPVIKSLILQVAGE
jgi:transcriptional regulator with XRE-family HTH domain